ncbi:hypothetical protein TNCV_827591 [Trichonephila clavipes]|nr:hypothetical protein TNCV_827591 [Trichonephila clavipes]
MKGRLSFDKLNVHRPNLHGESSAVQGSKLNTCYESFTSKLPPPQLRNAGLEFATMITKLWQPLLCQRHEQLRRSSFSFSYSTRERTVQLKK